MAFNQPVALHSPPAIISRYLSVLIFFGALLLYIFTLAPDFLWSDSAKLAIWTYERNFTGSGFGIHPMHSILGYLFSYLPFSLAYTQNLMSAVFGAGAVLLVFLILRAATGDEIASVGGAAALAVSQVFWLYSLINETYTFLAFSLALILFLLLKWLQQNSAKYIYLAAFCFGAAFANHALILLAIPGFLLTTGARIRRIEPKQVLIIAALFAIAALPTWIGKNPLASFWETTASHFELFGGGLRKMLKQLVLYPAYAWYQFPLMIFPAIYGLCKSFKKPWVYGTFCIALFITVFASQYFFQRQFPMLIPSFLCLALWAGEGLALLRPRHKSLVLLLLISTLLTPVVYYVTYRILNSSRTVVIPIRSLPYRNNYRYYFFPPKQSELGAVNYVRDAFKQASGGGRILSDFNPGMALLYGQTVLGLRKDLKLDILIDDFLYSSTDPVSEIKSYLRRHIDSGEIVYLADDWEPYYFRSRITQDFVFLREEGPLWRVVPKNRESVRK